MQVLCGDLDARPVAFVRARSERRVRRGNDDVDVRETRNELRQLAGEGDAARTAMVHLPVPGDERAARLVHADTVIPSPVRRTSMPGSFLPSMSSSDAPPPVEMCFILAATS